MEMFRGELWVVLSRVFLVKVIPALDDVGLSREENTR